MMIAPAMLLVSALVANDSCVRAREMTVRSPLLHDLYVLLETPRAATGPLPAVILIGGAGPDSHDAVTVRSEKGTNHAFRELSRSLVHAGFAVVRFDEIGVGRSTGDYAANATTRTLTDDVLAIVNALRRMDAIDPTAIMMIGYSEGGSIALLAASSDSLIAGVVSMGGPAWIGKRVVETQQKLWLSRAGQPGSARNERYRLELERENAERSANDRWYQYFLNYDPTIAAAKVAAPTLLLQAQFDDYVLPEQAPELKAAIERGGNTRVTLRFFEGLEHTMAGGSSNLAPIALQVVDAIVSWSGQQLGARLSARWCAAGDPK